MYNLVVHLRLRVASIIHNHCITEYMISGIMRMFLDVLLMDTFMRNLNKVTFLIHYSCIEKYHIEENMSIASYCLAHVSK